MTQIQYSLSKDIYTYYNFQSLDLWTCQVDKTTLLKHIYFLISCIKLDMRSGKHQEYSSLGNFRNIHCSNSRFLNYNTLCSICLCLWYRVDNYVSKADCIENSWEDMDQAKECILHFINLTLYYKKCTLCHLHKPNNLLDNSYRL